MRVVANMLIALALNNQNVNLVTQMKKLLKSLVPLGLVLTIGCSKKEKEPEPEPLSCIEGGRQFSNAVTDYAVTPNKANCEAYKKAARVYSISCADILTADEKKELEETRAEPCPN